HIKNYEKFIINFLDNKILSKKSRIILSGMVSAIAGIGGGVFFVSIMTLLFFIPINIAVDTSTFVILFSSLAGFITYLRQKRTSIKLSLFFSAFSIIGSILATYS
ncbi:unnamed protein product, partial [marine sediment metagenome]